MTIKFPFRQIKGFIRSDPYMAFVRTMPCCVCGAAPKSIPHHTEAGAMSDKCDDILTIPLCHSCHDELHSKGKETFYEKHDLDVNHLIIILYKTFIRTWIMKANDESMFGAHYDDKI